jgi:D-glycero-alpha-D-manno-heptose-7-phosphate kinase
MGGQDTNISDSLAKRPVVASTPCRIDMGGTLDISTFIYPLHHLRPCTFNLALDLRTQVSLHPHQKGMVKITSKGFESAEYPMNEAPFDHPMGLMFAVAAYFQAGGIHIHIESSSPPRSALGGSSAAAVALVAALTRVSGGKMVSGFLKREMAMLAYVIEGSVAGVPCGLQDQLAAAYGGVNAWYWSGNAGRPGFRKKVVVKKSAHKELEKSLLLAYCGIPHESKDINGRWVRRFISGEKRSQWHDIVAYTKDFVQALCSKNMNDAVNAVNSELAVRREMTPDVLDDMGERLAESAGKNGCGVRFNGAGGGGCIWAIGEPDNIERLRHQWKDDLNSREEAHLIDVKIDSKGLIFHGG